MSPKAALDSLRGVSNNGDHWTRTRTRKPCQALRPIHLMFIVYRSLGLRREKWWWEHVATLTACQCHLIFITRRLLGWARYGKLFTKRWFITVTPYVTHCGKSRKQPRGLLSSQPPCLHLIACLRRHLKDITCGESGYPRPGHKPQNMSHIKQISVNTLL